MSIETERSRASSDPVIAAWRPSTLTVFGIWCIAATGFALFETWIVPPPKSLALLAGAAVFLLGGYYFMVDAMRYGEVAVVSPFRYSVILWAILVGIAIWGEWPDALALLGSMIVTLAGLYTFMRERKVKVLALRHVDHGSLPPCGGG